MSFKKEIFKIISGLLPSPLKLDDAKGGGRVIQEVAAYPKEVNWDDSVPILKTAHGIEYVRTPDSQFENLDGYTYEPNYVEIDGLRMHYIDEGPKDGEIILLLHGQPAWSYLYRKMIDPLVAMGYRCIAPDLIGMGRSDKPVLQKIHTYDQQCEWILAFINEIQLQNINLFCQDWGGLIGLRLAGEHSEKFSRIVMANTDLLVNTEADNPLYIPNPIVINPKIKNIKKALAKYAMQGMPRNFQAWINYCLTTSELTISDIMKLATTSKLSESELAAYNAPFPSFIYCAGPRTLPSMAAGILDQTQPAWDGLKKFEKPFLSIIGLDDKLLGRRSIQRKMASNIPGANGQSHEQYEGAHHFIQEDIPEKLVNSIHQFITSNPI